MFDFLNDFSKKCRVTALVCLYTDNDFHWGLILVLSYSNPHTLLTCFEEEKRKTNNTILPVHGIVRK